MPLMGLAVVMLIGYVVTTAKNGTVDTTAYVRGKEPPSLVKFKQRHDEKANKQLREPKKRGGKEPGVLAQTARALVKNSAETVAHKHEVRSKAYREWYKKNADKHEQAWCDKWDAKLKRREAKVDKWKRKKGLLVDGEVVEQTEQSTTPSGGQQDPQSAGDTSPPQSEQQPEQPSQSGTAPEPASSQPDPEPAAQSQPAAAAGTTSSPTTGGSGMYYTDLENELRHASAQCSVYQSDLTTFADKLGGRNFGPRITGQPAEIGQALQGAVDAYADLADEVRSQGDDVANTYDANPDIPTEAATA